MAQIGNRQSTIGNALGESFQIPVFEDHCGGGDGGGGVEQRVSGVVGDEHARDWLAVRYRRYDVQGREVWHQVGSAGGNPSGGTLGERGEGSQVFGKGPDDEQGEGKHRRKKGRRKRRKQQRDCGDDDELENDEVKRDQQVAVAALEV